MFLKILGKKLCWSLFYNKAAGSLRYYKRDSGKVYEVFSDSFAGVLVHRYLLFPLNSYKCFFFSDIRGILSDSSARVLYHQYLLSRIPFRILLISLRFFIPSRSFSLVNSLSFFRVSQRFHLMLLMISKTVLYILQSLITEFNF